MKILNLIDLIVQSIILGLVTILFFVFLFTGHLEGVGFVALYGAIFLGPWQLVSSLVTTISGRPNRKWRLIHLAGSIIYLSAISAIAAFKPHLFDRETGEFLFFTLGFGIPIILAFFYYYITFRSLQTSSAKS